MTTERANAAKEPHTDVDDVIVDGHDASKGELVDRLRRIPGVERSTS